MSRSPTRVVLDLADLMETMNAASELLKAARKLKWRAEAGFMREILLQNYAIGEVKQIQRLRRGYTNLSYEIVSSQNDEAGKYLLRKYKKGKTEDELRFEHSLMKGLMEKGFSLVPEIIACKGGATFVKRVEKKDMGDEETFFALFSFLGGEDKYAWDDSACTDEELIHTAQVLAQYHNAACDLRMEGKRSEPSIIDLIPKMAEKYKHYAQMARSTKFDIIFLKNIDYILSALEGLVRCVDRAEFIRMPHLPIHCDYHPGNLKFRDGKVTGVLDFDWSKIDARCFDVALAIYYFCTSWENMEDGDLLLDKTGLFLRSYQQAAKNGDGIQPLDGTELARLPPMILASNLYISQWIVEDFYLMGRDPYEYLLYLRHNLRLFRWIENHWNALTEAISTMGRGQAPHGSPESSARV